LYALKAEIQKANATAEQRGKEIAVRAEDGCPWDGETKEAMKVRG